MGKIQNIGKKFKGLILWCFIILGGISAVIAIVKNWDGVLEVLIAIGKFLISTDGRQLVLFLIVAWLIIWLAFIEKRIRKLSQPRKEKKLTKKEKSDIKLDFRHQVILESLMRNEGRLTSFGLKNDYEKKFGTENLKDFGVCIDDLLELNYIENVGRSGPGYYIYSLKREGAKYIKKLIVENEAPQ